MEKPASPWSVPVAVEDIPDTGLHMEFEAPAAVRVELAKLAGVRELPKLSAVFDLIRQGTGVYVSGQVSARVGQTCVVTLEPIESTLAEAIDVAFAPALAGVAERAGVAPDGHRVKASEEEPPEPLIDGKVDLGALATEFLLLGIDPYPRKPGAEFAPPKVEHGGEHPFAALATLKKRLGGGQP
jgi:Large ribosomal RNA subunit accumulation protein YceD